MLPTTIWKGAKTMRNLLVICSLIISTLAWAQSSPASAPATGTVVKGKVLEIKDVASYTYLRLMTKDGETWAAINKVPVKQGADVTIENVMVTHDFKSRTLNKTFPTIIFGTLAGGQGAGYGMPMAHSGTTPAAVAGDVHVAKAKGANAYTVAEINMEGAKLKGKTVLLRGKVVKYNPEIMGRNWIHLQDGSGSSAANTNDILVTSKNQVKLGDVVTVSGVVSTDKDFGAGYYYKVLVENATLQ
jgi:hypothetical protein